MFYKMYNNNRKEGRNKERSERIGTVELPADHK